MQHAVLTIGANVLRSGSGLILLATPCFAFPLRAAGHAKGRACLWTPSGDGTGLAGGERERRHVSAPSRGGHGPPSHRPREPGNVSAHGGERGRGSDFGRSVTLAQKGAN